MNVRKVRRGLRNPGRIRRRMGMEKRGDLGGGREGIIVDSNRTDCWICTCGMRHFVCTWCAHRYMILSLIRPTNELRQIAVARLPQMRNQKVFPVRYY